MEAASAESRSTFPLRCRFPLVSPGLFPGISSLDKRVQLGGGEWRSLQIWGQTRIFCAPVFVLQLPVLVESVVVGFQSELRTLRSAERLKSKAKAQSGNFTRHRWIISIIQTTVGTIPV